MRSTPILASALVLAMAATSQAVAQQDPIIVGAAVAWVTCQGAAAAYLTVSLFRGRGRFRLRPHALKWLAIRDIMAVSGVGLLHSFCLAMTVAVITGYVGQYGTEALAGYGLGARLELMLVPIAFGVGAALTAAVGVNVGASILEERESLRKIVELDADFFEDGFSVVLDQLERFVVENVEVGNIAFDIGSRRRRRLLSSGALGLPARGPASARSGAHVRPWRGTAKRR